MHLIQTPAPIDQAAAAAAQRPRHAGWRVLRWLALVMLALLGLLLAAWLVLQWAILPRLEHWRGDLEMRASHALGLPVRIGTIAVSREGGGPFASGVELGDVVLQRADGVPALRLPRVRAALSPRTLLPGADGRWRWRFAQLAIDGAELDVRRDASGRLWVAGIELKDGAGGGDDGAADWFFSQPEFVLRGGTLRWHDELRGSAPLALSAVDLVVRNGVRTHALRLDATPPADWGARVSLRGRFAEPLLGGQVLARPGDWRRWRGELYAELPAIDVAPWRSALDLPMGMQQGQGSVRAWLELDQGRVAAVTADLALRELLLQADAQALPLAFARIDGRLSLRDGYRPPVLPGVAAFGGGTARQPGGELALEGFGFVTADGLAWPAGSASARWRLDGAGALAGGELRAERIDLALLAQTLSRLPAGWVGDGARDTIASLAPEGVASGVELGWEGPPSQPQRYRVHARLQGLGLAAHAVAPAPDAPASATPPLGRPGLSHADVELRADETGGRARIAVRDGALEFPGVFELPRVALERLDTELQWSIVPARAGQPRRIEARARELRFVNADAEGHFDLGWASGTPDATGRSGPGVLTLTGGLRNADATRVARYLPLGIPAHVRSYVEHAVEAGRAETVDVKVRGDLRRFPFATPTADTEFRIAARLDGVRFRPDVGHGDDPAHAWPAFTDVRGDLVFDRRAMELRNVQARLGSIGTGEFQLQKINGGIRDLEHATLTIEGQGRGPLNDGLRYVNATPVGGWIGGALAEASASGGQQAPAELSLALGLPLGSESLRAKTTVKGRVVLAGNDLKLRADLPPLANAKARIAFSDSGFELTNGSARALGGDLTLDGARQADGSLRFNLQGTASAEGLRRQAEGGPHAKLAARLRGQAAYRLALGIVEGQAEWQLTSNLAGLAADLPAPFSKAAADVWPLRAQALLLPDALAAHRARGTPLRDLVRVELGPETARLVAQWQRELGGEGGARVLRGGIGIGEPAPQPAEGVAASVSVGRLDLAAWQRLANDAAAAADGAGAPAAAATGDGGYLPSSIALRAKELVAEDRHLHEVVAGVSRGTGADAGIWRANLDAVELGGYAEYRAPGARGSGDAGGRVFARLARLSLPKGEDEAVSHLLEQAPTSSVPGLDIVVEDFELRGKKLGRLEIEAQNRGDAATREWRLSKLRLSNPDAQLNATGQWAGSEGRRRAQLDFKLDVADGGALLARLGQGEALRGAKGKLAGQLHWLGSPLTIDYPSLGGQINIALDRGQFLKADPGIAKLLGVLSLQALPRRLLLDFRDVFQEGFAFDTVTGDVSIASGVASTRNLRMRGVQAVVLMEGGADVARETQDLRVWVVPEINAGTAALAFAAINPAIGIGSFVAQWLLKKPIGDAGTREFRITGPWADPKVERIERKLRDPVPAIDEPASAPAVGARPDTTIKD